MADSIARLIVTLEAQTAQYQRGLERANKQLEGFGRTQKSTLTTLEGGFKRFSQSVHSLLAGGGILIGFRSIEHQLERVAEKFKDSNYGAMQFTDSLDRISKVTDQGLLSGVEAMAGLMEKIADAAEFAGKNVKALTNALSLLPGVASSRIGLSILNGEVGNISKGTIDRSSGAEALLAADIGKTQEANFKAIQDRATAAEKTAEATAKYNEDLVASRIEMEKDADERIAAYNDNLIETRNKNMEADNQKRLDTQADQERALQDQIAKIDEDHLKTLNAQADAFGSQFADNLVQAADYGFRSVLESWIRTLEQMALKAGAAGLFKALFENAPVGGFLSGIASIFGGPGKGFGNFGGAAAMGGAVSAGSSYLVGEAGPELFSPGSSGNITPNSRLGGVNMNVQIDARGAANPAQMLVAMRLAKDAAVAQIRNDGKHGR